AEGATVSLITMTRGGAGLWNGREAGDLRRLTDVRELELSDAAAELGVHFLEVFDYPDGALERVEEVEAVRERFLGDLVRCRRSRRSPPESRSRVSRRRSCAPSLITAPRRRSGSRYENSSRGRVTPKSSPWSAPAGTSPKTTCLPGSRPSPAR